MEDEGYFGMTELQMGYSEYEHPKEKMSCRRDLAHIQGWKWSWKALTKRFRKMANRHHF